MGSKRKAAVLDDNPELVEGSSAGASSAPTFKRARKMAPKMVTEKRAARIKTTCPKNIQERVGRVMSQRYSHSPMCETLFKSTRFFMIERERNPNELHETFKVLGSTGNVYTVRIDTLPSCDCTFAICDMLQRVPYSHTQVPMPSKGITVNTLYVVPSSHPSQSIETSLAVIRLSEGMQQSCQLSLD